MTSGFDSDPRLRLRIFGSIDRRRQQRCGLADPVARPNGVGNALAETKPLAVTESELVGGSVAGSNRALDGLLELGLQTAKMDLDLGLGPAVAFGDADLSSRVTKKKAASLSLL